jgi:ABC-type antimicrobial peptide transport system permease subunit
MSEALRNVAVLSVGIRPPLRFDLGSALVATVLAVVVVVVGAALPAWRASRLEIVEAIRDE